MKKLQYHVTRHPNDIFANLLQGRFMNIARKHTVLFILFIYLTEGSVLFCYVLYFVQTLFSIYREEIRKSFNCINVLFYFLVIPFLVMAFITFFVVFINFNRESNTIIKNLHCITYIDQRGNTTETLVSKWFLKLIFFRMILFPMSWVASYKINIFICVVLISFVSLKYLLATIKVPLRWSPYISNYLG